MAQDLHDDVGQELTGLGLKADALAEMLAAARIPARELAADIAAAVERTRSKVRGLSRALLPVELDEGLLACTLERLAVITTTGCARLYVDCPAPTRSSMAVSPCTCIGLPRRPFPTPCGMAGRRTSKSPCITKTARPN